MMETFKQEHTNIVSNLDIQKISEYQNAINNENANHKTAIKFDAIENNKCDADSVASVNEHSVEQQSTVHNSSGSSSSSSNSISSSASESSEANEENDNSITRAETAATLNNHYINSKNEELTNENEQKTALQQHLECNEEAINTTETTVNTHDENSKESYTQNSDIFNNIEDKVKHANCDEIVKDIAAADSEIKSDEAIETYKKANELKEAAEPSEKAAVLDESLSEILSEEGDNDFDTPVNNTAHDYDEIEAKYMEKLPNTDEQKSAGQASHNEEQININGDEDSQLSKASLREHDDAEIHKELSNECGQLINSKATLKELTEGDAVCESAAIPEVDAKIVRNALAAISNDYCSSASSSSLSTSSSRSSSRSRSRSHSRSRSKSKSKSRSRSPSKSKGRSPSKSRSRSRSFSKSGSTTSSKSGSRSPHKNRSNSPSKSRSRSPSKSRSRSPSKSRSRSPSKRIRSRSPSKSKSRSRSKSKQRSRTHSLRSSRSSSSSSSTTNSNRNDSIEEKLDNENNGTIPTDNNTDIADPDSPKMEIDAPNLSDENSDDDDDAIVDVISNKPNWKSPTFDISSTDRQPVDITKMECHNFAEETPKLNGQHHELLVPKETDQPEPAAVIIDSSMAPTDGADELETTEEMREQDKPKEDTKISSATAEMKENSDDVKTVQHSAGEVQLQSFDEQTIQNVSEVPLKKDHVLNRSLSLESLSSSSSFQSKSSANELVIDQSDYNVPEQNSEPSSERRIEPLKLSLKRKISRNSCEDNSEMPAAKQPHYSDGPDPSCTVQQYVNEQWPAAEQEDALPMAQDENDTAQTPLSIGPPIPEASLLPPSTFTNLPQSTTISTECNYMIPKISTSPVSQPKEATSNIYDQLSTLPNSTSCDTNTITTTADTNISVPTYAGTEVDSNNQSEVNRQMSFSMEKCKNIFKCSSCGTYHDNWNLFLHMREKHNRHICLYCMHFFRTAEKLSVHLEIKHDLDQRHYHSEATLRESALQHVTQDNERKINEVRFLMCCTCQHVFEENENFSDHNCAEYMQACSLCGQKERHTNLCKAHPDSRRSKAKRKGKLPMQVPHVGTEAPQASPSLPPAADANEMNTINCDKPNRSELLNVSYPSPQILNAMLPPPPPPPTLQPEPAYPLAAAQMYQNINNPDGANLPSNDALAISQQQQQMFDSQQQQYDKPSLPPDRVLLSPINKPLIENIPAASSLIVPKIKLRVPKEYQKSVDAKFSSTESEDTDSSEEQEGTDSAAEKQAQTQSEEESTKLEQQEHDLDPNSISTNSQAPPQMHATNTLEPVTEAKLNDNDDGEEDEDSQDEPNSNLERILKEIERTKKDIQRTKESITSTASEKHSSKHRKPQKDWSPTPPASPHNTNNWFSMRKNGGVHLPGMTQSDLGLAELPQTPAATTRRDTVGSDAMDIDESITNTSSTPVKMQEEQHESVNEDNKQTAGSPSQCNAILANPIGATAENEDIDVTSDNTNTSNLEVKKSEDISSVKVEDTTDVDMKQQAEKPDEAEDALNTSTDKDEEIDVCGQTDAATVAVDAISKSLLPADGITLANEDTLPVELSMEHSLDAYDCVEFVRLCLKNVYPLCLYCNHARRIAVNGYSLVLHMLANHRFTGTINTPTVEALKSEMIIDKLKALLPELKTEYLNSQSYCTIGDGKYTQPFNERIYECFQCRFVAATHKELYLHNRRMHLRTAILCHMCRSNFYSFSEILCHICPGAPLKTSIFEIKYRCCLCNVDKIPSPFRLMVHLRKSHFACDVCLEDCRDQSRLSSHVWKHKLSHLCYRCGIAYRNKMDITKHLFWKHGTESIICKRCLQKRWRHVYHFCVPPSVFVCDVCNLRFSKAMYLKVHKRVHTGDFRYPCTEENCEEKFVSRRLLLKHTVLHQAPLQFPVLQEPTAAPAPTSENSEEHKIKCEEKVIKKEIDLTGDADGGDDNEQSASALELDKKPEAATGEEVKNACKEEPKNVPTLSPTRESESTKVEADTPRKRKKQNKRDKNLLDDLNLMAPNLSESDSSDDSNDDQNSSKNTYRAMPKAVELSPRSDNDNERVDDEDGKKDDGKVMEIWKNFLQAQKAGGSDVPILQTTDYTEDDYPTPAKLHVAFSDHDYCCIVKPELPRPIKNRTPTPQTETHEEEASPQKPADSPKRRMSTSSESSSSSSCSCSDSNCSCSSSGSDSSSSSSSSDSDSSAGSDAEATRKRQRKRSGRKSESASPTKHHFGNDSDKVVVVDDDGADNSEAQSSPLKDTKQQPSPEVTKMPTPPPPQVPDGPVFYESDLETAESDTDEEFYDEHPQKLASELLAQKRAQLLAQTRLSPSHNYDIVENSRPSTPSLPEEAACGEKRVKLKKKKRERKSSNRAGSSIGQPYANVALPTTMGNGPNTQTSGQDMHRGVGGSCTLRVPPITIPPKLSEITYDYYSKYPAAMNNSADSGQQVVYGLPNIPYPTPSLLAAAAANEQLQQQQHHHQPQHHHHHHQHHHQHQHLQRMAPDMSSSRASEGSSCSDMDASLKRSKRARRPNKFYGYTSDDENMGTTLGQPLYIGMRAIKPQPPPQLTWRKEDLPTPSKSILNPKNKTRTPKTPHAPLLSGIATNTGSATTSSGNGKRKRTPLDKTQRKRQSKKKDNKLPPIPTIKIPLSQIGLNMPGNQMSATSAANASSKNKAAADSSTDTSSSDDDVPPTTPHTKPMKFNTAAMGANWSNVLPPHTPPTPAPLSHLYTSTPIPAVPVPQATAFNHKIPPALLPNPDFATLQYFKANNIRYPIRPPAGARQAREGESVYCYCRCPYDEVSEMIACDGDNCLIEWFHFECVGIILAPQGKWFCAECRPRHASELYPTTSAANV